MGRRCTLDRAGSGVLMKPIYVHFTVALMAAATGAAVSLWMGHAAAQTALPQAASKPSTMPASMPAVPEPAAITAQRAALTRPSAAGKPPVFSSVIEVSKLAARNTDVGTRRDLFDGPTVTLNTLEGHISTLNP